MAAVTHAFGAVQVEGRHRALPERKVPAAQAGRDGRDRDGGQRLRRPPGCAAAARDRDGNERQQADRRQQRAGDEGEPEAGIPPEEHQPGERDRAVGEGEPERDVAEREHRGRERQGEARPRRPERGRAADTTAIAAAPPEG